LNKQTNKQINKRIDKLLNRYKDVMAWKRGQEKEHFSWYDELYMVMVQRSSGFGLSDFNYSRLKIFPDERKNMVCHFIVANWVLLNCWCTE
jgi:hypothetical protein